MGCGEEAGDPGGAADDAYEHRPVWLAVPGQGCYQHREQQIADDDRLDERERAEMQRHNLEHAADDVHCDRGQPQRPPGQIGQQPGRQRSALGDLPGAAVLHNRGQPEKGGRGERQNHGGHGGSPDMPGRLRRRLVS
jgi:hypothetical protein